MLLSRDHVQSLAPCRAGFIMKESCSFRKEFSGIIRGDHQHNMMQLADRNSCVMSIEQPRRDEDKCS